MKVKCTRIYHDLVLDRLINVGEITEVSDDRGRILLSAGVAELIELTPTTPEVVTGGRKKGRKK